MRGTRDGFSLRSARAMSRGKVRAEVALLDDPVQLGEGDALGEQVRDRALAARRGLGLLGAPKRSARGGR